MDLHQAYDMARTIEAKREIDGQAYLIHLDADTYENDIHNLLTEEQHARFHAYLEARGVGGRPSAGRFARDADDGDDGTYRRRSDSALIWPLWRR